MAFIALSFISENLIAANDCQTIPPSANCTPGYIVPPADMLSTCSAVRSAPVQLSTKTSRWTVNWPDDVSTTFTVVSGGNVFLLNPAVVTLGVTMNTVGLLSIAQQ